MWTYGVQMYDKETISYVERIYGCLPKNSTPMPVKDYHPKLDDTPLLGLDDHRKFQMLLGILQLMVTIDKPELCQVVSSLDRFGVCPDEGHFNFAVCCFGYFKTTQNKQIVIYSIPIQFKHISPVFHTNHWFYQ